MINISQEIIQFSGLKSTGDILLFSLYGVLFVLTALLSLSVILLLFKFINKREMNKIEMEEKKKKREVTPEAEELRDFDDDIVTAIITAIAIEEKLYHEDTLSELTLRYKGENLSGWQLSDLVNNGS